MKHKQTQHKLLPVWAAVLVGLAFSYAPQTASASDGYPTNYQVISGQAIKRPAPTRQKRAFKPVIPVSINPNAGSRPVQNPKPAVMEPSYAAFVPASVSAQTQPVIASFNPYTPGPRIASPQAPGNVTVEAAPSWGYTSQETASSTISPPPLPEPVVEESKPEPKPVVKKSTPQKSSSRSRSSSYSRRSSGNCRT